MDNSYKKIRKHLQFFEHIYNTFIILSILMVAYVFLDIYSRSKKIISFADDKKTSLKEGANNRLIIQPRMQMERTRDDFHYIISESGVWDVDTDIVDLFNVKADSTLGTMRSDVLTIKDDNMLLEFRGNPVFILYLEDETNEKKEQNEGSEQKKEEL